MEVTKPIFKLDLEPGDILHLTLGGEIGNGSVWIPTEEDLDHMKQAWEALVPDNVRVIATTHLAKANVIRTH